MVSQEEMMKKIERRFQVPERVADKVRNVVEKARGGYVLFETRPPWDGSPGPWTKSAIAKISFDRKSQKWLDN